MKSRTESIKRELQESIGKAISDSYGVPQAKLRVVVDNIERLIKELMK